MNTLFTCYTYFICCLGLIDSVRMDCPNDIQGIIDVNMPTQNCLGKMDNCAEKSQITITDSSCNGEIGYTSKYMLHGVFVLLHSLSLVRTEQMLYNYQTIIALTFTVISLIFVPLVLNMIGVALAME